MLLISPYVCRLRLPLTARPSHSSCQFVLSSFLSSWDFIAVDLLQRPGPTSPTAQVLLGHFSRERMH